MDTAYFDLQDPREAGGSPFAQFAALEEGVGVTILIKLIGAVLFGALSIVSLFPLVGIPKAGVFIVLGGALLVSLVVLLARTGRHAWAWGFVLVGLPLVLMPLVVIPMLSSIGVHMLEASQAAEAKPEDGQVFAAWVLVIAPFTWFVFSVVGLLVGAASLFLGLVMFLSARREVVIVHRSQTSERAARSRPRGRR